MRVTLITDKPDHPVLAAVTRELATRHSVRTVDPGAIGTPWRSARREMSRDPQQVFLLKAHDAASREFAGCLQRLGALVINDPVATSQCQDRLTMSRRLLASALPCPPTVAVGSLFALLGRGASHRFEFPIVVKSRWSRRGDLVKRIDRQVELEALSSVWMREPVVIQPYAANDGWDRKVWVVDDQIFAARRPTPLEGPGGGATIPIASAEVPAAWRHAALAVGRAFGLRLYGLDLVIGPTGPLVVDVNAFPGYRGVHGAIAALVTFAEGLVPAERATA